MNQVFNELNVIMNNAIKRQETPGDIITALTSCVIGVINCLKVTPEIKAKLAKQTVDLILKEVK